MEIVPHRNGESILEAQRLVNTTLFFSLSRRRHYELHFQITYRLLVKSLPI